MLSVLQFPFTFWNSLPLRVVSHGSQGDCESRLCHAEVAGGQLREDPDHRPGPAPQAPRAPVPASSLALHEHHLSIESSRQIWEAGGEADQLRRLALSVKPAADEQLGIRPQRERAACRLANGQSSGLPAPSCDVPL